MIHQAFIVVLFLIYPFYALPGVFYLIYRNKYIGYILLALFLALLAFQLVPREGMDLDTHYNNFELLYSYGLSDILDRWGVKYFVLYSFAWAVLKLGFEKNIVPFIFGFSSYIILFGTYARLLSVNSNGPVSSRFGLYKQTHIWFFIIVLMNAHFWGQVSGLRTGAAFVLLIFAIFNYDLRNKKFIFLILGSLAIAIHPASFLPLLLFVITRVLRKVALYRMLLWSSLIVFFLSEVFYYQITAFLRPYLVALDLYSATYFEVEGRWSGNAYEHMSLKGYIYSLLFRGLPYYLMVFYIFWVKKPGYPLLYNYACLLLFVLAVISTSYAIYQRYVYFFTMYFCFYLILEYSLKEPTTSKRFFLLGLFIFLVFYNLGTFYSYYDVIIPMFWGFVYVPLPLMFLN